MVTERYADACTPVMCIFFFFSLGRVFMILRFCETTVFSLLISLLSVSVNNVISPYITFNARRTALAAFELLGHNILKPTIRYDEDILTLA